MKDWVVDSYGVHNSFIYLNNTLAHIKKAYFDLSLEVGETLVEVWYDNEDHYLKRVYNADEGYTKVYSYVLPEEGPSIGEITLNEAGTDVAGVREDAFFSMETESWQEREGESTLILTHERYQQIVDDLQNGVEVEADESWWTVPDGDSFGSTTIEFSDRPTDEGKLFFRIYTWNDANVNLVLRTYLEDGDNPYLAVTKENIAGLQVYPNPARNGVQIKADVPVVQIDFYDSTGKKVLSTTQTYISTAQLSKGVYTVKILDNRANIAVKKLVIR